MLQFNTPLDNFSILSVSIYLLVFAGAAVALGVSTVTLPASTVTATVTATVTTIVTTTATVIKYVPSTDTGADTISHYPAICITIIFAICSILLFILNLKNIGDSQQLFTLLGLVTGLLINQITTTVFILHNPTVLSVLTINYGVEIIFIFLQALYEHKELGPRMTSIFDWYYANIGTLNFWPLNFNFYPFNTIPDNGIINTKVCVFVSFLTKTVVIILKSIP